MAEEDPCVLIFMLDATGSMSSSINAMKTSFPQICKILSLFAPNIKIYISIYRDFDCGHDLLYKSHGPYNSNDIDKMINLVKNTDATGGGDAEEAQKYAFHVLKSEFEDDMSKKIVIHFTDAPPHSIPYDNQGNGNSNKEKIKMNVNSYNPDWLYICNMMKENKFSVYTIGVFDKLSLKYYASLANITNGAAIVLKDSSVNIIQQTFCKILSVALGYPEYNFEGLGVAMVYGDILPDNESDLLYNIPLPKKCEIDSENSSYNIPHTTNILSLDKITNTYKKSIGFRQRCFKIFCDLIKSGNIIALTYNPILGQLYRQMCRKSPDPNYETRREELHTLMSNIKDTLSESDKKILDKWLEESYNRIEEINELIISAPSMYPFFVIQSTDRIMKKDMTNAARTPMPHNLALLSKLVSSITLIESKPKVMPEVFVPLSLKNGELFALLTHLMCPGTKMDLTPSIIIAIVVLNTGHPVLSPRAYEFLSEIKGSWFKKDSGELFLFGFLKIVMNLHMKYNSVGGILTTDEVQYILILNKLASIMYNNPEMKCKRLYRLEPKDGCQYADHKLKCIECNQFRSLSVMTDQKCGLCLSYDNSELQTLTDDDSSKSYIYMCSCCKGLYAVRNIAKLNTTPKCHYCRNSVKYEDIPHVNCSICEQRLIVPSSKLQAKYIKNGVYMCCLCELNDGVQREEEIDTRMHEVIKQNPWIIKYILGFSYDVFAFPSIFKLSRNLPTPLLTHIEKYDGYPVVKINGRPMLNNIDIVGQIQDICDSGKVNTEPCQICYSDFMHIELYPMCRTKGCSAVVCKTCIAQWYSTNKPGTQFLHRRIRCPCCDHEANIKIFKQYNMPLYTTIKEKKVIPYSIDWHYGWCQSCYSVKEYIARECAGQDPFTITNYICDDCNKPGHCKKCPQCGILTQKQAGCNHMECPIAYGGCGIHWCYYCDEDVFSSNNDKEVYDHMWDVHGQIYDHE
jgi:hypothetical protein